MKKNPVGRPPKYQRKFHPNNFIELSEQGKTFAQIAKIWKVDRDTINEWRKKYKELAVAVKRGRQLAEAWYIDLGQSAMLGSVKIEGRPVKVELGWFVWMTKNMFKWSDSIKVGTKILDDDDDRPLKDLTDEELEEL